jgi:hypothetical protein
MKHSGRSSVLLTFINTPAKYCIKQLLSGVMSHQWQTALCSAGTLLCRIQYSLLGIALQ